MKEIDQCRTLNGAIPRIGELDGRLTKLIELCNAELFTDDSNNVEILKAKLLEAKSNLLEAKSSLMGLAKDLEDSSPWW